MLSLQGEYGGGSITAFVDTALAEGSSEIRVGLARLTGLVGMSRTEQGSPTSEGAYGGGGEGLACPVETCDIMDGRWIRWIVEGGDAGCSTEIECS